MRSERRGENQGTIDETSSKPLFIHCASRNVLIITAIRGNVPALIRNSCTVNRADPTFRTNKFNVLRRKVVRGIGRNYNH